MTKRLASLDLLRGAMLVLIAINHSPFWIRKYTEEFVGYVSAAEGFVFVSAFLGGMLFSRQQDRGGFLGAADAALRRALRIYRAHLLLLAFVFLLARFFLPHLDGVAENIGPLAEQPWAAGFAGLLLLFQPSLLDILPLYVVFSLLTPAAFLAARRAGWLPVLGLSFGLWFWSHFALKEAIFAAGKGIAFINPGAFDLFAWQLIWIGGLWLGQRRETGSSAFDSRALTILAAVVALFFLALRWSDAAREFFITDANWWMFDKWQLGPLRLLNFAALAALVARAIPWLEECEPKLRGFSLIGRHMLPVFCTQIAFSVLLNGVSSRLRDDPEEIAAWLGLQVACAFGLARALEGRKGRRAEG